MEKNVSELSIIELKAFAYDQMVQIELSQNNLRILNQELSKRLNSGSQNNVNLAGQFIPPLPPGSVQTV